MINEIVIENKRTEENITINKDGSTGFVIDEMDWDTPSISNESYRIPFQIGETISSTVWHTKTEVNWLCSIKQINTNRNNMGELLQRARARHNKS